VILHNQIKWKKSRSKGNIPKFERTTAGQQDYTDKSDKREGS
jgi:hypothetical protein